MKLIETALAVTSKVDLSSQGQNVEEGLTQKIAELLSFFFGNLPSWIAGVIVFLLTILLARVAKKSIENRLAEHMDEEENEGIMVLGGRIAYVSTLSLGVVISLKIAGIDLTSILAAVAFGIGFALRDLIMNFLAGVFILVSKPFIMGDFINIDGNTGKVEEIQSRVTVLKATNGTRLIVPNSLIFTSAMTNYTANPTRRVDIPLYVAYGTDLDYAIRVTLEAIKGHTKILVKPKPSVRILNWGDSSIDLKVRFWVARGDSWYKVRHDMMKIINKAYTEAGINVPYNILHVETEKDTEADDAEAQKLAMTKMGKYMEMDSVKAATKVIEKPMAPAVSAGQSITQPAFQSATQSIGAMPSVAVNGNGNGNGTMP
ncbi:MAG: mechanosensitive ion channel family protein, partial [Patescibacteria group bacterium]